MSLKNMLEAAKLLEAAHKRQQELLGLDLNPEEYMLLREDKSQLGLELLDAILEGMGNTDWVVDRSTHRLMRKSPSNAGNSKFSRLASQSNGSSPGHFSIGLTSNSKRFFLKVYRDYLELSEFDLVKSRFITDAIKVLDQKILSIEVQREQEKYLAIEHESMAIVRESQLIQTLLDQVHELDSLAFFSGEERIQRLTEFVLEFSNGLPDAEVVIDELDFSNQESYEIIDDVPCKNTLDYQNNKIIRSISNGYIKKCINFVNLIRVDPIEFTCRQHDGYIDIIGLNQRQHDAVYQFWHKELHFIKKPYSHALASLRENLSRAVLQMKPTSSLISIWDLEFDGGGEEAIIASLKFKINEMAENVRVLQWKIKGN
jgi:hypothetical protein